MLRILIVDDKELERRGLEALLERAGDMEIVGHASDGLQAIAMAQELAPDVVLMDIGLPELDGLHAAKRIKEGQPLTEVLVTTQYVDEFLVSLAKEKGAKGFVYKGDLGAELAPAVRAVHAGGVYQSSSISKMVAGDKDSTR